MDINLVTRELVKFVLELKFFFFFLENSCVEFDLNVNNIVGIRNTFLLRTYAYRKFSCLYVQIIVTFSVYPLFLYKDV